MDDYDQALIQEAKEMVMALSVYFNIAKPSQDRVIIALSSRWGKPVEEILEILSAVVKFKAKVSLLDCFYGDLFHHDVDEKLVLTPDVVEIVYSGIKHEEPDLIKSAIKDLAETGLYIEWIDIKFEYLS